jgi:tetratricopeptide (TPR) repeat protein
VALDERGKTYRGSPYERCSLDVYRAICQYNAANYPAALAATRNAIANDAETHTKVQHDKEDFGMAYFVAALCYARMGERDNAMTNLELAKKVAPGGAKLTPEMLDANFVGIWRWGPGRWRCRGRLRRASSWRRVSGEQDRGRGRRQGSGGGNRGNGPAGAGEEQQAREGRQRRQDARSWEICG